MQWGNIRECAGPINIRKTDEVDMGREGRKEREGGSERERGGGKERAKERERVRGRSIGEGVYTAKVKSRKEKVLRRVGVGIYIYVCVYCGIYMAA